MDLAVLAAGVIALGIILYVVLDGFDLGVGILFPFAPGERARDTMIASIGPFWDGNETWLVMGGAVLFGAFPAAYARALPALYLPITLLLVALIFRGISFEFRAKATAGKAAWSTAFSAGSTLAAFAQGILLGGLIDGVRPEGGAGWASVIALIAGLGVVAGYALLGATWLVLKTDGALQTWARRAARPALIGVALAMAAVSLYTPLAYDRIAERWFGGGNLVLLSPVPIATAAAVLALWAGLARGWEWAPFALAVALFLLGYLGIAISLWPAIVPPDLSIWQAAAPRPTLVFVLIAVAATLPMILVYIGYAYHVFRGKVRDGGGYGGQA